MQQGVRGAGRKSMVGEKGDIWTSMCNTLNNLKKKEKKNDYEYFHEHY